MRSALTTSYNPKLLPIVREFLSRHPEVAAYGAEELADRLRRLAGRRLRPIEVETALEALRVEGEVVA